MKSFGNRKPKILLLAGEESGVLYAERLAGLLRASGADIRGYGDYGFQTADLAVMGFWPVLRRIFYFLGVKRTMERVIREWRPDAVCTVDYPGMNLKLAAYAKSLGIRAVHVVCPQVWA
jgi:lipid-A-disaccharide synthase